MNYLSAPGHPFGSNSSINLKRTDSLRRPGGKTSSPIPVKKSFHKTVADDESAALLNQTPVWAKGGQPPPLLTTWWICRGHAMSSTVKGEVDKSLRCCKWTSRVILGGCSEIYGSARGCGLLFSCCHCFVGSLRTCSREALHGKIVDQQPDGKAQFAGWFETLNSNSHFVVNLKLEVCWRLLNCSSWTGTMFDSVTCSCSW